MTAFRHLRLLRISTFGALAVLVLGTSGVLASSPATDVRLSNDAPGTTGYVSADDLAGLPHYTDAALAECSRARGRQNEPSVAINPRDSRVIVGSSNDYCAVYNGGDGSSGAPIPSGPIWLGYYRSENSGASFQSSLVPGYPGDTSTLGALAAVRTASSGDPVLAWDAEGRLFVGSESSDDATGSPKSFGDVWVARYANPDGPDSTNTINDGKLFQGTTIVAKGSSAPYYLGKFNDKTALEVDRTDTSCRGNVYFSWSRFTGSGGVAIYLARSTDHGMTFSSPTKLTAGIHDVQFPEISVTSNGHVYVTFRQYASGRQADAIDMVKSTDCGRTFSPPRIITTIAPMGLTDLDVSGAPARDCGDGSLACQSGFTFFRGDTGPRATSDQADSREWIYLVYEAILPGSEVNTGTTFGWADAPGKGGQSAIYFIRLNGATGSLTAPVQIAPTDEGQQILPDLAVDNGTIHALWWDSRNDVNNDASSFRSRPIGNAANGDIGPGLDVYASTASISGGAWTTAVPLSDVTSNGQYEQFGNRTVPFGGDYLWIDSKGGTATNPSTTFGVWTDWRNTVPGTDPRDQTGDGADVLQCRADNRDGTYGSDTCPRDGGLDQDIYGDLAP